MQNLAEGTLMKQYRATKEQLALWRDRKAQRMQEIEALQVKICKIAYIAGCKQKDSSAL